MSHETNILYQQALQQHQRLSSRSTGNIYPGNVSTISNQTSTHHWQQRVTCCNALSVASTLQSHLLLHQQQTNQVQQSLQLRYYQISSPSSLSRFPNQSQHHLSHQYTLITGPSSSSSPRKSDNLIEAKHYENFYSGYYVSNHLPRKILKANTEELINTEDRNFVQSFLAIDENYQPRYEILSSDNFSYEDQIENSEYLKLENRRKVINSIEKVSSKSFEETALIPEIFPVFNPGSLLLRGFVNAINALPDMLENVRPGRNINSTSNLNILPLLLREEEFSYHEKKPQLTIRLERIVVAAVQNPHEKNWQLLSSHRASLTHRPDRLWNKLSENPRKIVDQGEITSRSKTYAAAVQEIGREDNNRSGISAIIMNNKLQQTKTASKTTQNKMKEKILDVPINNDFEMYEFKQSSTNSCKEVMKIVKTYISNDIVETITNEENSSSQNKYEDTSSYWDSASNKILENKNPTIAERFCFGKFASSEYFGLFDQNYRRTPRMAYTKKF